MPYRPFTRRALLISDVAARNIIATNIAASGLTPTSFAEATRDGLPKRSFAYTPSDDPSDWALPYLDAQGAPDTAHLAAAAAALSEGGYRGQRASIPVDALTSVKAKLRQAYRRAGKSPAEMPAALAETSLPRPAYVTELLAEEAMQPAYVIEALADEAFGEAHGGHFFGAWDKNKHAPAGPRNPYTGRRGPASPDDAFAAKQRATDANIQNDPTMAGYHARARLAGDTSTARPQDAMRHLTPGDQVTVNGDTGNVVSVNGKTMTLKMLDGSTRTVSASEVRTLDYEDAKGTYTLYRPKAIRESDCPECEALLEEAHAGHFFGSRSKIGHGMDAQAHHDDHFDAQGYLKPGVTHYDAQGYPLPGERSYRVDQSTPRNPGPRALAWEAATEGERDAMVQKRLKALEGHPMPDQEIRALMTDQSLGESQRQIVRDWVKEWVARQPAAGPYEPSGNPTTRAEQYKQRPYKPTYREVDDFEEGHAGHFFGNWRAAQHASGTVHYDGHGFAPSDRQFIHASDHTDSPTQGQTSMEVHSHHDFGTGQTVTHSHPDGTWAQHPGTGPAQVTIDKTQWLEQTGLRGGGTKRFTKRPTGPQLPIEHDGSSPPHRMPIAPASPWKRRTMARERAASAINEAHIGHFFGHWPRSDGPRSGGTPAGHTSIWDTSTHHTWGDRTPLPKDPLERVRSYHDVKNADTPDLEKAMEAWAKYGARTTADAQLRDRIRAELERRKTIKPALPA